MSLTFKDEYFSFASSSKSLLTWGPHILPNWDYKQFWPGRGGKPRVVQIIFGFEWLAQVQWKMCWG